MFVIMHSDVKWSVIIQTKNPKTVKLKMLQPIWAIKTYCYFFFFFSLDTFYLTCPLLCNDVKQMKNGNIPFNLIKYYI